MDRFDGPYWVIGGEYADTKFERLAKGAKEERLGPFPTYEGAYKAWRAASWRHVDQCYWRFRIVEAGEDEERKAA